MAFIGGTMLLMGLVGLRMALKDVKEEGWSYSRLKFVVSIISLLMVGTTMVVVGLFKDSV
jgi:hypothetical protein